MRERFLNLISKHKGIIYKLCRMYSHQEQDFKDLFQEVLIQLWKSFPSFHI